MQSKKFNMRNRGTQKREMSNYEAVRMFLKRNQRVDTVIVVAHHDHFDIEQYITISVHSMVQE